MNNLFHELQLLFKNGDETAGPGRKSRPAIGPSSECLRRRPVGAKGAGQRTVPLEVSFAQNRRGTELMMLLAQERATGLSRGRKRRLFRLLRASKPIELKPADARTAKRIRKAQQ